MNFWHRNIHAANLHRIEKKRKGFNLYALFYVGYILFDILAIYLFYLKKIEKYFVIENFENLKKFYF